MKNTLKIAAALAVLTAGALVPAAQANPLTKHPTATGIGAGMMAHHMAKHAHGGMMHRHPMMTGVGAGMIAHHMAKKHAK